MNLPGWLMFCFVGTITLQSASGSIAKWIKFLIQKSYRRSYEYNGSLSISPQEVDTEIDDEFTLTVYLDGIVPSCVNLTWKSDPKEITSIPDPTRLCPTDHDEDSKDFLFEVFKEGIVTLTIEASPEEYVDTEEAFSTIYAMLNPALEVLSDICGWIYTIAWDFSFLPQIIHNWKRKSVVGLSFDYICFNFIGFSSYFIFNAGLYWGENAQAQYEERNPNTVMHVRINDVIFPLCALACTSVVIVQCFIYEKSNQRVSWTCRIICTVLVLSEVTTLILALTLDDFWLIDFLYWCSYVKLMITCIKYFPQLYLNYKRKSTEGWSIWNVVLDFTGGTFSLIQMFLLAGNYDDWDSLWGDPTKLGLGILSIFFNILFFIQHFCVYRKGPDEVILLKKEELANDFSNDLK